MGRRMVVSGCDRLRIFDLPHASAVKETPLASGGALCSGPGALFAASDPDNAVYRLNAKTLLPDGVFAGGPGMRALCLSRDGERLYALLADADSVLMLSGCDGAPMMLARVGVNPQSMRLDDSERFLVVAGGEDGCAYLLCSRTLKMQRRFPADGVCCDAVCRDDGVHALLLTQSLGSRLATWDEAGRRTWLDLPGPPGALLAQGDTLLAAAGERLYEIAGDGARVLRAYDAAGRAGKLIRADGRLILIDPLTETLHASCGGMDRWRMLCAGARDAALLEDSAGGKGAYSS